MNIHQLEVNTTIITNKMKCFAVLIVCLVAAASAKPEPEILVDYNAWGVIECRAKCDGAFATCPEINCPLPPVDSTCPRPNCSSGMVRIHLKLQKESQICQHFFST